MKSKAFRAVVFFLAALLLFPAASTAAINTEEILALSKKAEPQSYDHAIQQGAKFVPTKDGHSFELKEGDRAYMNGRIEGPSKTPI